MRFETARRLSEVNRRLYDMYVGPVVRWFATDPGAELLREVHPNRLRFGAFCDVNPAMGVVKAAAESVRTHRRTVAPDNPLLAVEESVSKGIAMALDAAGAARDAASEQIFLLTYGSPALHAIVGLDKEDVSKEMQVRRNLLREQEQEKKRSELEEKFETGGVVEAVIRVDLLRPPARGRRRRTLLCSAQRAARDASGWPAAPHVRIEGHVPRSVPAGADRRGEGARTSCPAAAEGCRRAAESAPGGAAHGSGAG